MDDLTFLRNLARRGKVVLLADGAALPSPVSVMDDESRAGASFRINMVSPEMVESGDRRTFKAGSTDHRELPIPLMWQWQLDDGHKTAVVVGRIDSIERISGGLGNARGVFDTGPWGAEAERMVRNRMLRGVSGDYTNFDALVLEKVEDSDNRLLDDKINVQRSKLVAATIVAKPAFEGCWIEILEEDEVYPDGVTEAPAAITAAAFVAGGHSDLVDRLLKLEALEARWQDKQLAVTASAVRSRVESHRLQREREDAIARIRGKQNLTAAWKPLSSAFLSAKAKLQPRDSKGRWIEMGSMVRWLDGIQIGGDKPNAKSGATPGGKTYRHGRVVSYNAKNKKYTVQATDGRNDKVELEGKNLEVVQALIPDTPEEAQAYADSVAKDRLERGDSEMNRKDEEHFAREQREGKFVRPEDDDGIEPATGMTEAEEDTLKRAKDATEPVDDSTAKSATTFLDLVDKAGGIEGMDEYVDEVQNGGPAGRSPGQFDSMKELLDANEDRFTDREWNEINAAFQGMKKDVLDSPGEETIESLDRPAPKTALPEDLPDPTDDALTVPADWKISKPAADANDAVENPVQKALDEVSADIEAEAKIRKQAEKDVFDRITEKFDDDGGADPDPKDVTAPAPDLTDARAAATDPAIEENDQRSLVDVLDKLEAGEELSDQDLSYAESAFFSIDDYAPGAANRAAEAFGEVGVDLTGDTRQEKADAAFEADPNSDNVPEFSTSGGSTKREILGAVQKSDANLDFRYDFKDLLKEIPAGEAPTPEQREKADELVSKWSRTAGVNTVKDLFDRLGQPVEGEDQTPVVDLRQDAMVYEARNESPYEMTTANLGFYRKRGYDALRGSDDEGDWMLVLNKGALAGVPDKKLTKSDRLDRLAQLLDEQAGSDWITIPSIDPSTGKAGKEGYRIPRSVAQELVDNRSDDLKLEGPIVDLAEQPNYGIIKIEKSRDLTPAETTALDRYTMQSKSLDINGFLRSGSVPLSYDGDVDEDVAALDEAINTSSIQNDTVVYRGLAGSALGKGSLEPGTIISDKGFISTSNDANTAATFAGAFGDESAVVEIQVPKGSKGYNTYNSAGELILPRGSQLVVEEDGHRRGQRIVKARLQQNEVPNGNLTEMAKSMFENLHPDQNWGQADQQTWVEAAKKAVENQND